MKTGMISKRVLSMLLAFAMLVSMMPVAAYATEEPTQVMEPATVDEPEQTVEPAAAEEPTQAAEPAAAEEPTQAAEPAAAEPAAEGDAVASVTTADGVTTEYATLAEAVSAAQGSGGSTVKVLQNVDLGSERLNISGGTFTLDLNGKTITSANDDSTVRISASGWVDMTITDSSASETEPGTGTVSNTSGSGKAIYHLYTNGILKIRGGNFIANDTAVRLMPTGEIYGGTFESKNAYAVNFDRRLTIYDGSFTGGNSAIYAGTSYNAPDSNRGYIYGGTFEGGQSDLVTGRYSYSGTSTAKNYILYGGTFPGGLTISYDNRASTTLANQLAPCCYYYEGGTRLTAYASSTNTGTETVTVQKYVEATVTTASGATTEYGTLADAIAAAQGAANSTLTLQRDITTPAGDFYAYEINGGTFTLDLNGKTIDPGTSYGLYVANATLTITDTSEAGTGGIRAGTAVTASSFAHVTIQRGTYTGVAVSESLTIEGGSFSGKYAVTIGYYSADLTIKGGTFTGTEADLYYDIGNNYEGTTALSGGSFTGGLQIALTPRYDVTFPTVAQVLTPMYSYFVGENRLTAYESDTSTGTEDVTVQKYVEATVTTEDGTTTEYGALAQAITAAVAAPNSTLTLQQNITTPDDSTYGYQIDGGTFTLDLNGRKIDLDSIYGLYVMGTTLTITDSSEAKTGGVSGYSVGVIAANSADVTIHGGAYNGGDEGVRVSTGSTLTVEDGSFTGKYAVSVDHTGNDLRINGGTFTGTDADLNCDLNSGSYASTTVLSGGAFPGGLRIVEGGPYAGNAPTAAQLLAGEHSYFEGDSDTILKASAEDPYTVAGELVTVDRKLVVRISLPQEVYDYNGGVAVYTFDVAPDAAQESPIPGTIATYFDGELYWEGSDPVYDGKTGIASYIDPDWAPGAHTIQVVFTPEDTTLEPATSNTLTFVLEKVQVTAENWTQFFGLSNTTHTYDGTGKAAALTSHWNSADENLMYVPQEDLTLTYWQGDTQVENPTNAGSYTVKFRMVESTYFKPVTELVEVGTLTIEKADLLAEHLDSTVPTGDYYNGQAFAATAALKSGLTGCGEVTVEYLKDGETGRTTTAPVTPGTYTAYACVTGGDNFHAGEVELGSFTIEKPWPGMGVGIYVNGVESYNALYEDEVTMSATLGAAPPSAVPTGTFTILANNEEIGPFPLEDGRLEASLSALDAGTYSFVYIYSGDDIYAGFDRKSYSELVIRPRAVTLEVTGTEHRYDGNAKTITFENNTKNLTMDDFTVTYYLVNENMGTISKVNRAVSTGRYLYVVELKDEFKTNYTFANPITIDGDTLPEGTFDNAGFMEIAVGLPEAQEPIYFTEGALTVYLADGTYAGNTLINPNNTVPTYTSSNPDVAEVAADGTVTLKRTGTVTIFAASEKEGTTPVRASYTLTIGKKEAAITVNGLTTTYGEAFTLSAGDLTVTGCTLDDLDLTNLTFTGYTVGQSVGTYYITPAGITSQMYDLTFAAGPLTVQPRPIDASAVTVTAAGKRYDGTTDESLTAVLPDGVVLSGDKVTVTAQGAYADANAGTTLVNITSVTLEGKDADNYVLTGAAPATAEGKIEKATVTFTTISQDMAYDGTAKALDITARTNNGLTADYTVRYSDTPILPGTYTVSVTLTDTVNYTADTTGLEGKTLTIVPAVQQTFAIGGLEDGIRYGDALTLTAQDAEGDVTFTITEGTAATISGSTITATGVGRITVTATSVKEGCADKVVNLTVTVGKRLVTPVVASVTDRAYNGKTEVSVSVSLSNLAFGDNVTATAQGQMATADAGTDKLVYVTGIVLSDTEHYALDTNTLQTTVDIAPIVINTITVTAEDKTYDGTTNAGIRVTGSDDILPGDEVTILGTGRFAGANAGSHTVTVTATGLSGVKAANYELGADVTATAQAAILPATVVFEIGEAAFLYDGTPKAVPVTAALNGKAFTGFTVTYSQEDPTDVGTYEVTVTLNDSQNYTGAPAPFPMAISPADQGQLVISGMPGVIDYGKVFTLTTNAAAGAAVTWTTSDETVAAVDENGIVTILDVDREVTITATVSRANHRDITAAVAFTPVAKQVSFQLSSLTVTYNGAAQGITVKPSAEGMTDYEITYTDENGKAVTPVDAGTYHVEVKTTGSKYVGSAIGTFTVKKAALTGTLSMEGWTYGQSAKEPSYTLSVTGITPVFTYSGQGLRDGAPYGAGDYTVTATFAADNYETLTLSAAFEVKKATLTVTANDAARAYGESNPAFTTAITGFVHGDTQRDLLVVPTATTEATTGSDVGTYAITASGGRSENYEFHYVDGTLTVAAAQGELYITGASHDLSVGDRLCLYAYMGSARPNVIWSSSDPAVATIDEEGFVTVLGAGTTVITAKLDEKNYVAGDATFRLTTVKKAISLLPGNTVFTYNGAVQSVEFAEAEGFVPVIGENVRISYTLTTDPQVTTLQDAGTYVATYEITDPGYEGSGIFTVYMNKARRTVRPLDMEKTCGEENPAYTIDPNCLLGGDVLDAECIARVNALFVFTCEADADSLEGTYPITLTLAPGHSLTEDPNYDFVIDETPGTLIVRSAAGDETCPSARFTDLNLNAWYHTAVDYVVAGGLMNGICDTLFAPHGNASRGMIVTVLYRLEKEPDAGSGGFTDVSGEAYYAKAIAWAAENGIVLGYGDGTFRPDQAITREELALIMHRYAAWKGCDVEAGGDLSGYQDAGEISGWAYEAMTWANATGLIRGRSETTLVPGDTATRAEMAAILMRLIENILIRTTD